MEAIATHRKTTNRAKLTPNMITAIRFHVVTYVVKDAYAEKRLDQDKN